MTREGPGASGKFSMKVSEDRTLCHILANKCSPESTAVIIEWNVGAL